jgi:hypothetical protein
MRSSSRFKTSSLKLRAQLARFFGFYFFIVIAVAAILVTVADTFLTLPLFEEVTPSVTAFTVAVLLIYIIQERASVLDDIQERLESSGVQYISNQQTLYMTSAKVMIETTVNPEGKKQLLLAALHGYSPRVPKSQEEGSAFDIFDKAIFSCIMSPDWEVKNIFNINTPERLNIVEAYIERAKNTRGFQVRAFSPEQSLPHTSPLIIGEHHVIFAIDDLRYYRVKEGIHIRGRQVVAFAEKYFESLWNDRRAIELKSEVGPDYDQINVLRTLLEQRQQQQRAASTPGVAEGKSRPTT